MEDPKNKSNNIGSDFGMESENPKINHYTKDIKPGKPNVKQNPNVDPSGEPPEAPKPQTPPEQQTLEAKLNQPQKKVGAAEPIKPKAPHKPAVSKKALFGCLGAFAAMMLILLILSFVFLAQSDAGQSPIAKLLNIDQAAFINGLITFVHLIFVLVSLTAFVFTMVGLFKASMAKKGDKIAKKSGLKTSLIAGVTLLVILIVWMFVYLYLDSKRISVGPDNVNQIVTEPEETLNLTAPIEVKFDASGITTDPRKFKIVSYDWDFGDGDTGTNQITSHVYSKKGTFTVLLSITVQDIKSGELMEGGQFTEIVSVANQALTATFSADPQSGEAPLEVKFDASESVDPDGIIERYEWDLDEDGEFDDADEAEIEYTFEKIGIYTIGLRVTSTTGDYNIYEKDIIVEEATELEPVIRIINDPETFTVDTQYIFKADESTSPNGKIEEYEWDFGDGSATVDTKTASHTFEKAGSYEVVLKIVDEEEEEGETTMLIEVLAAQGTPVAVIKSEPALGEGELSIKGKVPLAISFDASASTDSDDNIVDYEWDFNGDGTVDEYTAKSIYTYTEAGTYTVTLSVIDADDNVGKDSLVVKVEEQGIAAAISADPIEGNIPLTVHFDASGSSYPNGQITSYQWDFGDRTAAKLGPSAITHRYKQIGTYTASVRILGADNTTDTAEILITVREVPLEACFVTVFEEGPAPLETTFDPGCSTGTVSNYFWDFGDGLTSTSVKPKHTFEEPGDYTVNLEISDSENNISKAQLTVTVTE